MPTVTMSVNLEEFTNRIGYLGREQIPFATALALSRCGDEAAKASIGSLSSKFIVRNNWLVAGYRVEHARKNNLVCTVSHKDHFMALQEFGGEKTPLSVQDVAVPVGARSDPSALTPQSKWPGHINRRFYITKGGNLYEYARTGRRSGGKRKKKHLDRRSGPRQYDPNIKLMYVLKKSVHVRPRLGLVAQCRETLAETFGQNFEGFLRFAVATAK